MTIPYSYGIFHDPIFIRKNTLLNFLHSHFPAEELQSFQITSYSDLLRASYHDLPLENDKKIRLEALSLTYSTLIQHFNHLSELDWFYIERIVLHFANLSKPVASHTAFLLKRR